MEGKVRLNLNIPVGVRVRLEYLKGLSQAESLTEVIRRASELYEHLLVHQCEGGQLILRSQDGQDTRIILT